MESRNEQQLDRQPTRRARVWTPLFVLTIAITFFAFVAGQGLNMGMSVYVEHLSGTATFAGLLAAVFSASAAVARIVMGPVIDSRGRMVIMVTGSAVLAIGVLLPGLFPNETVLVVSRFIQGVGFASATTAAATAAADVLPNARMAEGIGYYGLGQALATSVGPAFALYLLGTDPAENLFFVMAAIAGVACALSASCRYERHPEMLPEDAAYRERVEAERARAQAAAEAPASRTDGTAPSPSADGTAPAYDTGAPATTHGATSVPPSASATGTATAAGSAMPAPSTSPRGLARIFEPRALPGAIPMLFMSSAFGFAVTFAGLYGESLGIGNAGMFYTCSAVSMIAIRLASKPLMDALLPIVTFAIAAVCGLAAFVLLLAAGAAPAGDALFYLAGLFYGVCLGVSLPLNQSVAVANTPPERWGAANALYLLASDAGIGIASIVWGITNDTFGFTFTICCVIACIVISYLLAWVVYPVNAKRRPR